MDDDWKAIDALVDKVVRDVDAKRRRKAFRIIENEEFDGEAATEDDQPPAIGEPPPLPAREGGEVPRQKP